MAELLAQDGGDGVTASPFIRVLVCGGRDYADREKVRAVLEWLAERGMQVLIHGCYRGADTLAAEEWRRITQAEQRALRAAKAGNSNKATIGVRARWTELGGAAGPLRNAEMLTHKPDLVVAFPGRHGTADMVRKARAAGVRVKEIAP